MHTWFATFGLTAPQKSGSGLSSTSSLFVVSASQQEAVEGLASASVLLAGSASPEGAASDLALDSAQL